MAKSPVKDLELKLRFRQVLFCEGFWSPIEVELSQYDSQGTSTRRQSLTDLDVLGIRFDGLFNRDVVVADCKTAKRLSDVSRLFWLRGVMDYFGADEGYYLRPTIAGHAKAVAPKMGLRVLDQQGLAELENRLEVNRLKLPVADIAVHQAIDDLWGIVVAKDAAPTEDQLRLKNVYAYLSYSYWYIDAHRNLMTLVSNFQEVADLLEPTDPRHLLMCYVGVQRFAHCLLDVAAHVQAQGGDDIPRLARMYLFGGPLALKEKERLFQLLNKVSGTDNRLDPPFLPDVLEALGRLLRNPRGASNTLRHLEALYLWNVHLGNKDLIQIGDAGSTTAAVVLAKDIAKTFAKASGIPDAMFGHISHL